MRHQVEMREPFLDFRYALGLDADALVHDVNGQPGGKAPLRDLYNLYPDLLPRAIRDRSKIPFGEGAGLDVTPHTLDDRSDVRNTRRKFAPQGNSRECRKSRSVRAATKPLAAGRAATRSPQHSDRNQSKFGVRSVEFDS